MIVSIATVVFVIAIVVLNCCCCGCFQFEALSNYSTKTQEHVKTGKSMGWVRVGGCYVERRTTTLRSRALAEEISLQTKVLGSLDLVYLEYSVPLAPTCTGLSC